MSSYSVYAKMTRFMLGSSNSIPLELIQADVNVKSIRLKPNGVPKEAVSFPSFKYVDIAQETWYESTLFELLDSKKFLFSVFEIEDDDIIFKGINFGQCHSRIFKYVSKFGRTQLIKSKMVRL